MSSKSGVLYIGATNDLDRRTFEHKQALIEGFTKRYRVTRLVYFEQYGGIGLAIAREKQIKGLLGGKKIALIESKNPEWKDLSDGYIPDNLFNLEK